MFHDMMNGWLAKDRLQTQVQRESDLIQLLERILRDRLPRGWNVEVQWNPRRPGWTADALMNITSPDGTTGSFLVEANLDLEPKMVNPALTQLERASIDLPAEAGERGAPLLVARFVSPRAKALIEEAGANYADAAGNLRINLARPAVFILQEGESANPWRETRSLRSLKGRSAARIIRALCDFDPPVGVRELAERSGASLGSTSRTLDFLSREALIERDERKRVTRVLKEALIRRWADDFRFSEQNEIVRCFEPRRLEATVERLRATSTDYAITGSFAANAIAPLAEPRLLVVYTADPVALEAELQTARVSRSSNVWLVSAPDELPFLRARASEGLRYAAPSQVACDLLDLPGRSPEEADAILQLAADEVPGGVGSG